jgi:hypothetical protein
VRRERLLLMENVIVWLVVTLVGSFGGSYLGAYFKKKGENLATHEDIDKLVEQVSAVTKTTKEIEAKISDEVWDRQRKWEVKRDVLLDAMKKFGVLPRALSSLHAVYREAAPLGVVNERRIRDGEKWSAAIGEFDASTFLVELVCGGGEVVKAMREFSLFGRECSMKLMAGETDPDALQEWTREVATKFISATNAARKELGFAGSVTDFSPTRDVRA